MPENLTLAVYLEKRGSVKALTRIEAEVFGVPYPLQKGWAYRHGAALITQEMLSQLQEKIERANSSTAEKAQRGLNAIEGMAPALAVSQARSSAVTVITPASKQSSMSGFALRRARRYRQSDARKKLCVSNTASDKTT